MILFLIGLGLWACAGHQRTHAVDLAADRPSLNAWLEQTLIPYLLQQLEQHPRFRGQPILLVRMQGENVSPQIDELTEQIRQKINDALLKKSGLDLVWRPAGQPWQHHRRLADLSCGDAGKVRYYIGIDLGVSGVKGKLYLKVRALNLAEQKWVSGFGQSWQGTPTADQLDALAREHPDEYLRGLRPLPFSDRQPDMLAAYLARNLSCLLRQGEADDLVVHVADPAAGTPLRLQTALELVGRYLARFREVTVTDDPDQANVSLVSEIHAIDQRLHQIWVSVRQRQGQTYLPGAETEAYVMMYAPEQSVLAGNSQAPQAEPLPPLRSGLAPSEIIASFALLTPLDQRACQTGKPWQSKVQRVDPRGSLPTGSCLAVEMDITTPAYVFVVAQDAPGELSLLFPSDCPALAPKDARLQPGVLFQFPALSDPQAGALKLAGSPGTERIYAIAITEPQLAAMFAGRMKEIQSLCRTGQRFPFMLSAAGLQQPQERILRWQSYLNWLSANNPGLIEWREFKFRHAQL